MTRIVTRGVAQQGAVPVTAALVVTLALQTAVPPFATDMYTPAFPQVTDDLTTLASMVGLTLTAFFLGLGLGQLVGGPVSDQRGRRGLLVVGGIICTLGAIGCALAPSIWVLVAARVVQGLGGGVSTVVARAVLIDVARGDRLARIMSLLMALGGLAPMIAPVAGAGVLAIGTWRTVFWALVLFGLLMTVTAVLFVPETLPPERRHAGGLRESVAQFGVVLRIRSFVGYMLTSAFSAVAMFAYISTAPYVLQEQKGMGPFPYALFFASTALAQVILSILNARLVGRLRPRTLIVVGLSSSTLAVLTLTAGVVLCGTPLVLTCAGFLVLMASQAFIFGNASALAASEATHIAGAASAVQGVTQAVAMGLAAPLASAGGASSAVPMVLVMLVGVTASWVCCLGVARGRPAATEDDREVVRQQVAA